MSGRGATRIVDVVLDAPASVSIYLQALAQAGRHAEATAVVRAHEAAAREASILLAETAGWNVMQEASTPVPHRYEPTALTFDLVLHQPPDHVALHSHVISGEGADVSELQRHVSPAQSCYSRHLSDALTADLGLRIIAAPSVLELAGVPSNLVRSFERAPCRLKAGAAQARQLLDSSA